MAVGALLAEGGEGKVHEVVGRPDVLYKAYRRPVALDVVAPLLAWRQQLGECQPALAGRVRASTSWPTAPVTHGSVVTGLLIPRAPARFSIRHRDGVSHLATLSYLTADPRQRAAAYGVALPPAASVERVGLVYALARLLEAFTAGGTTLAHGDLSTKNVLWSLRRGPEVYLIDCDSSRLFGPDGRPVDDRRHPQVATPNWDDPAASVLGIDPGPLSDRYSLALIFLRVVGAGHYPIQQRQKRGEHVAIDVELPPWGRRSQRLTQAAEVWDLCSRGLSVRHPADRPDAGEWVSALEATLGAISAGHLIDAVCSTQGGGPAGPGGHQPGPAGPDDAPRSVGERDVTVRAVTAEVRAEHWRPSATPAPTAPAWRPPSPGVPLVGHQVALAAPSAPISEQVRAMARSAWRWWWLTHRRTGRALRTSGRRRQGLRRLGFCVMTDFVAGCFALFLFAMMVSPFLGI